MSNIEGGGSRMFPRKISGCAKSVMCPFVLLSVPKGIADHVYLGPSYQGGHSAASGERRLQELKLRIFLHFTIQTTR